MRDARERVCEAHTREYVPRPRPNHYTRANFAELARSFVNPHVDVRVWCKGDGEAESADAAAAYR